MSDDHYNQPAQGAHDWNEPLNENFADLGVEVANEVATWGDLPATTEVSQSSGGQWPVYRVADDAVFVRVTDSATEIVGGLGSADHPLPESHHEAINTEEGQIDYLPNQGLSIHNNKRMQTGRTLPMPTFERVSSNPLFALSDTSIPDDSDLLWPSPITTQPLPSPDDNIYLFFSSHQSDGFWLATASSPNGAYAQKGSVISTHREGSVFYNEQDGQLWAYRNTQNTGIVRYTSADGKSWTQQETVIETFAGHAGIPWVHQGHRGVYLITNFSMADDDRKPTIHFSEDGTGSFRRIQMQWEGEQLPTGYASDGSVSNTFLNVTLTPFLGGFLVFYQDRHLLDGGTYDIRMGFSKDGHRVTDLGVALDSNGAGAQSWEDQQLATPAPFWYDGELWLFYTAGSGAISQEGVGLAKADFDNWRTHE